ncbi:MAG: hypothetical protein ACOC3X_01375 [Nanoarchaeota archaeon]
MIFKIFQIKYGFVFLFILLFTFLNGCLKVHETVFTARDECIEFIEYQNSTNLRNSYDECVVLHKKKLENNEFCEFKCKKYCDYQNMSYSNSWADFSGCTCNCKHNLKSK